MKGNALIKNGRVIDGTGAPAFTADLRIKAGRIVEIGPDLAPGEEEVFNADGCYVSPGFIDTHAHYDGSLYWDPKFDPIAQHGVTTLLIGNCGLGIAPIHKHQIPGISALFSYIEDLPRGVFDTEVPWTWGDFDAYVSDLRSREYAVNVATLVSHSLLRMFEVGDESWNRPSTAEERKRLTGCLDRAMKAGAFGFSTSRFDVSPDGNKVPSYFADAQEWDDLFAVTAENKGVVQIIPDLSSLDNQEKDLREMCELSIRHGGVSVMSNGIYERPEDATYATRLLKLGREMRTKGAAFYYFASPRSIELVVNFHQCMVMMYMPAWADLVQSVVPDDEKKRRLADQAWRATARQQWDAVQEGFPSRGGLARCRIITVDRPEYEHYLGKTFDVILGERGGHPSDVLADWALENNLRAELVCPFTNLDLDVVGQLLAADETLISGSDAGAHIGMFDGAGDTTLVLTRHVRDRHDMPIEVAVKRMSSDQAKILGLVDRGTLEVGKIADVAVFNLDDLNWAPEKKVFDVPGGGSRLRRPAGGFRYTFVSGVLVQQDGEYTGAMPARFLGQEARVASPSPIAARPRRRCNSFSRNSAMFSPTNDLTEAQLDKLAANFDHHSPEYRSHSIDILGHMQKKCPFTHSENYGGFWISTKASDCLEIAKNVDVFSNYPTDVIPDLEPTLMIPINVDPPELYDYRAILGPAFGPAKAKALTSFVRETAEALMSRIVKKGEGDLKWDYALPLTGKVTCLVAGLPAEDWEYYAPPLHELIYSGKPMEERLKGMAKMIDYMRSEIARLKDAPVPGSLIEYLYNVEMAGRKLRADEIEGIILILLGGGLDTTQALFGMSAVWLARNPGRRDELIHNPHLMDNAIEEFLRVFPPTQGNVRRATADVAVAGQQVRAGEQVFMSYAAANRDPEEYENPHEIDFHRDNIRHLSFGLGPHRCLGSHVARLQAKTMLQILLDMAPEYQLVEDEVQLATDIGNIAGFAKIQIRI